MKIKRKIFIGVMAIWAGWATVAAAAGTSVSVARAFYELARQNNTQKIETLLYRGYSLESADERGYTPVCLSVIRQNKTAYKTLVSYGANKNPDCLQKIPDSAYRRFFGVSPAKTAAAAYQSDTPYLIGAAALGAGAIAAAYIFRGSTDSGSSGEGGGGGGEDPEPENCPPNSHLQDDICICNNGYGNYGDWPNCYAEVANCGSQEKDTCKTCEAGFILSGNVCYAPINNCATQNGAVCDKCDDGYGTHGGDKTFCYQNIDNCKTQFQTVCQQCNNGYGNYGDDTKCYQDIDKCFNQIQDACKQCEPGYNTYGDPYKCYDKNPCADYPNSVPSQGGAICLCDAAKGYTGDPYTSGCTQTDGGDYNEGDDKQEEWNNYNELYCNSHGQYDVTSKKCLCYAGYASDDCSSCQEQFLMFGNVCFRDLECNKDPSKHLTQQNDACVCDSENGYTPYYNESGVMECMAQITCELHYEQTAPNTCTCKANFDENCENCEEGFEYDGTSDACVRTQFICDEAFGKWTGEKCDICPAQYKVSADGKYCGLECADNRAPIISNPYCEACAAGYEWSNLDDTCVTNECTTGQEGYIVVEDGAGNKLCQCDTANGWGMSTLGKCEKKAADLIGIKDSNINNAGVSLENSGELRDVYGMKPVLAEDEDGNVTYYDSVYNSLSSKGAENGTINIENSNTGGNRVYGVYSQSDIYNSAAINTGTANTSAKGTITITDTNTYSDIYGLYNDSANNIYNGFAYGSTQETTDNTSTGTIKIDKTKTSYGNIVGIHGGKNIYNAYANTDNGIGANANATGNINITHKGSGTVTGIYGTNSDGKINNSLAYLNSAVSDAVSRGSIVLSGNDLVYGIYGAGTIVNSETQFDKSYNIINNFSSYGLIDVTTTSETAAAYGMYTTGAENKKTSMYNAMGYNSSGNVKVTNSHGGSAYGLYSRAQTYKDSDGTAYYNNTYNAFRSSARYGDGVATGNIDVLVNGYSQLSQSVVGIFAAGNVYNSYANSGSDVKLETVGNIHVTDDSDTANIKVKGIESGGATIANAYSMGQNLNTETQVTGNIELNITKAKDGLTEMFGIYSGAPNPQGSHIYNAALVNDKNNVAGNIAVKSSKTEKAPRRMYGIYAIKSNSGDDSEEAQPKYIYNAYYENSTDISEGNVRGEINVIAQNDTRMSDGEYYGIYIQDGEAYNAYSSNDDANVVGIINVDAYGGSDGGTAAGMYGQNATLNNSGKGSSIRVISRGKAAAYGMKGQNTHIYNNAQIDVESVGEANAYGLYANMGSAVNDKDGVINVTGNGKNYGIYAISDGTSAGSVAVINRGTINLNGTGENIGIYAAGETATVNNSGTININGEGCSGGDCNNGSAIVLENGATYDNSGTTSSFGNLDFDKWGGNVVLSKGGKFEAGESISGDLKVSQNVVTNTFDTVSAVENALSAEDVSNLNLSSKSYLYNAGMAENDKGKYDVVMEMKDFSEVTDSDKAAYLAENYANEKNNSLFNALKTTTSARQYDQREADIFGTSVIPNMAQENLKVQRSLDRAMMSELFKDGGEIRRMVGVDGVYIGRDDHGTLSGYDINSQSMYALYDQKLDNRYRLGLGLSLTHTNTDYNNDSTRKSFMVQGYVPLTYANNGLTAVSMARLGFADGDYRRKGYNHTFEADTTEITYGWLNELRYKIDLGVVNLTPFVGLNAVGWYQDGIDEGNDALAINVASSHIFSLESALGLYLDKEVEFNQDNKLNVALGIGYYHEFADPYRGFDARINDTLGSYKLRDIENINSRNRGILSAKVNYDYKAFSIYGELMQYLEDEYPIKVDLGLKYRF